MELLFLRSFVFGLLESEMRLVWMSMLDSSCFKAAGGVGPYDTLQKQEELGQGV